jgi:hypothetical protein
MLCSWVRADLVLFREHQGLRGFLNRQEVRRLSRDSRKLTCGKDESRTKLATVLLHPPMLMHILYLEYGLFPVAAWMFGAPHPYLMPHQSVPKEGTGICPPLYHYAHTI